MTVFFFLRPQGIPEDAGYQHCMIALAEGFRELGIAYSSNIQYWREEDGWLFDSRSDLPPEKCDLIITTDEYTSVCGELPMSIFGGGRRTVFVDSSDGWRTRAEGDKYRRFDMVLRTHFNRHYSYPVNIRPWAFGLTGRIMAACADQKGFADRAPRMLSNFRVGHPVRKLARRMVMPVVAGRFNIDESIDNPPAEDSGHARLLWEATGRRHYPAYFERLRSSRACGAFGGYFSPGVFHSTENVCERALYALGWRLDRRSRTVMQFDSWRFWEALCAGTVTLHVDLETYGCALPSMPKSGTHYVGIDFEKRDCAGFIRDATEGDLAAMSAAGRAWALQHYSPRATAQRLLDLLDGAA